MKRQQGFSYLVAMFVVAILAVISLRGLENSASKERRAQEAELLFIGKAYRDAIRKYYENSPGFAKHYPPDVASLLRDARATRMSRPLRRLYWDPITASQNWGVVPAPGGGVMGVYSLSLREPMKVDGFPPEFAGFTRAKSYQDWKFVFQPS